MCNFAFPRLPQTAPPYYIYMAEKYFKKTYISNTIVEKKFL